jgi:7-carboxy-7-deazaguanine synthase
MNLDDIANQVTSYGTQYVTVTGGEPLGQKDCPVLLSQLCDVGYEVSLETSGALDISGVDPRVIKVMDLKTPGSGEEAKNLYSNLAHLQPQDQVKFVICSRGDYEWAKEILVDYGLESRCEVLFSPAYGQLDERQLAEWILEDHLTVRFQLQLHKILWGEASGK